MAREAKSDKAVIVAGSFGHETVKMIETKPDIAQIEIFFGALFDFDPSADQSGTLCHFDGFVHWTVYLDTKFQHLLFIADRDFMHSAFPVVEIGIHYSSVLTDEALGVGPVLQIRLKDSQCEPGIRLTKTGKGRLSLATTLGNVSAI